MAFTKHGHQIPGSPADERPFGQMVARCGGPTLCQPCAFDVKMYNRLAETTPDPMTARTPDDAPVDYPMRAKTILINYIDSRYSVGFEKPVFEVYVVMFSKTLQNWKALLGTDRADGKYYEITHDGDRNRTYVDEYVKLNNAVIQN